MDKEQIISLARKASNSVGSDATPDLFGEGQIVAFYHAAIESYKAELLKEVGEPFGYLHQWIEYHPYGDTVAGEPCSTINNEGKPFDKSDTVTLLFTSDQVAAAIAKATKPLEDQLAAAQEANEHWQRATAENENKWIEANDKLAKAEQRVAEACAELAYAELDDPFLSGHGYANRVSEAIRSGEYRKFVKEEV